MSVGMMIAMPYVMKNLKRGLPTQLAYKLDKQVAETRWLIEGLWTLEGVGIVGGEAKSYKTFLALAMGVAVASGKPCLGEYKVHQTGSVLVFCGEDQLPELRKRIEAIAIASGTPLESLPIHVITSSSLRIDVDKDRVMLDATVAALKPKLLILDPFVRLHNIDENKSGEVAPLLGYLRVLQRDHHVAVALVHHAKKGGKNMRGGQSLRGSSEFHAWGDCNWYPRRRSKDSEEIILEVEHRNAPPIHGLWMHPERFGDSVAMVLDGPHAHDHEDEDGDVIAPAPDVKERIITALTEAGKPMARNALRKKCRARTTTIITALDELVKEKRVVKSGKGAHTKYGLPTVGKSKKTRR